MSMTRIGWFALSFTLERHSTSRSTEEDRLPLTTKGYANGTSEVLCLGISLMGIRPTRL